MTLATRLVTMTIVLASLSRGGVALGDDKLVCIAAADETQRLRDDGHLIKARARALDCARPTCPGPVSAECAKWASDIEASMPTVALSASDGHGHDLSAVRVTSDAQVITETLDGKALAVDPGPHLLRFEAAGKVAVEEHVIMHQGERNRLVVVVMKDANPVIAATAPVLPVAPAKGGVRPLAIAGYVVAGAGVAALAVSPYLWVTGSNQVDGLRADPCARTATCSQSSVDAVRTKFIVGDTLAAVGGAAIAAGVTMVVVGTIGSSQKDTAASVRVSAAPGAVMLSGSF